MAVVITPLSDTPTAPHQSTNGSFYKDRDVRPQVHIAPDLADYPPVSHLFHVQPLEAFLPPVLFRQQHHSFLQLYEANPGPPSSPINCLRLYNLGATRQNLLFETHLASVW